MNSNWKLFSKYRNEIYGVSILSIIIFHYFENVLDIRSFGNVYNIARIYNYVISSIGVEWFCFLSGMGIFFSLSKSQNIILFYKRRFKKIIPLYIMIGVIYWIIIDIVLQHKTFREFIYDVLLISFWKDGNRVLWYISFIIFMYIISPLIFSLVKRYTKRKIAFVSSVLVICFLLISIKVLFSAFYSNTEIAITRVLIFYIGSFFGYKIYNNEDIILEDKVLFYCGIGLKICGVFFHFYKSDLQKIFNNRMSTCFYSIGLLYILIIVLEYIKSEKLHRFLSFVGTFSLELYLSHVVIRSIMNFLGKDTSYLFNYILCILLSIIYTVIIERILKKLKDKNCMN